MAHMSDAELEAERQLIAAAQRDNAQFEALYRRYVDQIFAYILGMTKNRELAEDLTAATFVRAYENLARFQWRGVPYSAWLYRVAANLVARNSKRPLWIELGPQHGALSADPTDIVVDNAKARSLRELVMELPRDQRQVVLMRFGGDLSNKEIGHIMGRSEGAVKLLTFRALTTLRDRMGAPQPSQRQSGETRNRQAASDF